MRSLQQPAAVHILASGAALLALVSALSLKADAQSSSSGPAALSFNRDIRPILSNNCFACHGPDEKKRETDFHFEMAVTRVKFTTPALAAL